MNTKLQDPRIAHEMEFHDKWAGSIRLDDLLVKDSFESPTAIENRYVLSQLGSLKGKRILDLGCGAGEGAVYFALQGAESYAFDISPGMVEVARTLSQKYGVQVKFVVAEAGRLPYPDQFFDLVFGNGVLHHVDFVLCAQEVRRVLKPSGKAAFVEPLAYNPIIQLYRKIAKEVRTDYEVPLNFRDIQKMQPVFKEFHHREFWLASLLIFTHFFFIRRWHPGKVRYWKKVIEAGYDYEKLFGKLQAMDKWLLKHLPFLKPFCWNTVLIAKK